MNQKKIKNNIFSISIVIRRSGGNTSSFNNKSLEGLQIGHPGISRMRSYVYCYDMDNEIENLVKICKNCALAAKTPTCEIKSLAKNQ